MLGKIMAGRLQDLGMVSIDFECYDPMLTDKTSEGGTDAYKKLHGGYPISFALYTPEIGKIYLDTTMPEWRLFFQWFGRGLCEGGCTFVGANLKYELAWLHWLGCWGPFDLRGNTYHDVLLRAALIDSTDRELLSLDGQAKQYGLPAKTLDDLYNEARRVLGKASVTKKEVYTCLPQINRDVLKEYNTHDTVLAWEVFHKQAPLIVGEKLEEIYALETRLLPVLAEMEAKGCPIDTKALDRLSEELGGKVKEYKKQLGGINPNASDSLRNALRDAIPDIGLTPTGKAKTDSNTLQPYAAHIPWIATVLDARKAHKMKSSFVDGAIRKNLSNGRVYGEFRQLASDTGGTVTGRLASGNPNLQQIPKRDPLWGPKMRALFKAEDGALFCSADYSKQEPRITAHFAEKWNVDGGFEFAQAFRDNPKLDPHSLAAELAGLSDLIGKELGYLAGKTMNLGMTYGQQSRSLSEQLAAMGVPEGSVATVLDRFHKGNPHVEHCNEIATKVAKRNGYIRTIGGRKTRFDLWVPMGWSEEKFAPLPRKKAEKQYLHARNLTLRRANLHAALNYVVQGSAADQMKLAMCNMYYNESVIPNMQVHDEANIADADEGTAEKVERAMLNTYEFSVPFRVGITMGLTWAG